ncbi:DUF2439 domain-containing protein [Fusarium keratoplasticum]|uniref:DUF2439 domain-containing protein n=1 Tax=Fusarium keratoplasticum TaxID=1328300 RepID=A0ACC0R8C9_9HYPO|nr:DUF2439 domain-containing protein [Fusarium keratoplasticum]KAI8675481.1 DUF2439 domain-containing protein [Fusarium keratoplasticum]
MAFWMNRETSNLIRIPYHQPMRGYSRIQHISGNSRRPNSTKPYRTEELQSLYDRWRELEDWQKPVQHPPGDDIKDHLQPEGPSPGNSDRSSVSSHSGPEDSDHGKKPRRRGPLSKTKREKTAFMRRLGACPPCRSRKVACKHWDLRDFEASYLQSKRGSHLAMLGRIHHDCLGEIGDLARSTDLLGLTNSDTLDPPGSLVDLDLAGLLPSVSTDTPLGPTLIPLTLDNSALDAEPIGKPQLMRSFSIVAIGRDLACTPTKTTTWQCLFWNDQHAGAMPVMAKPCTHKFTTPTELMDHFFKIHHPVELYDPPIWCGNVEVEKQEQWIYGYGVCASPSQSPRSKPV